jgi:hypothetical protein
MKNAHAATMFYRFRTGKWKQIKLIGQWRTSPVMAMCWGC